MSNNTKGLLHKRPAFDVKDFLAGIHNVSHNRLSCKKCQTHPLPVKWNSQKRVNESMNIHTIIFRTLVEDTFI